MDTNNSVLLFGDNRNSCIFVSAKAMKPERKTPNMIAIFTDYKVEYQEGKRGIRKRIATPVIVEDTLIPASFFFDGKQFFFYTRLKDQNSRFKRLYHMDGAQVLGFWQHGRYGSKMHQEGIELDGAKLVSCTGYSSGQIKDQKKYLKSIIS